MASEIMFATSVPAAASIIVHTANNPNPAPSMQGANNTAHTRKSHMKNSPDGRGV